MSLDCAQAEDRLSDYIDGSLDDGAREEMSAHLARCAGCRSVLDGLNTTIAALRNLPPEPAPPGLREDVMRAIAREAGGSGKTEASPSPAPRRLPLLGPGLGAVAAALLLFLTYGVFRESRREASPPEATPKAAFSRGTPPSETASRTSPAPEAPPAAPGASAPTTTVRARPPAGSAATDARAGQEERVGKTGAPVAVPPRAAAGKEPRPATERAERVGPISGGAAQPVAAGQDLRGGTVTRVSTSPDAGRPADTAGEDPGDDLRRAVKALAAAAAPRPHAGVYRREIVLLVPPDGREGLERRIAESAARFGGWTIEASSGAPASAGMAKKGFAGIAAPSEPAEGSGEKVAGYLLPASTTEMFLADLRTMGRLEGEGLSLRSLPDGVRAPETVVLTVRIRVR